MHSKTLQVTLVQLRRTLAEAQIHILLRCFNRFCDQTAAEDQEKQILPRNLHLNLRFGQTLLQLLRR